jgi:hypothetical protein
MKTKMLGKLLVFAGTTMCLGAAPGLADNPHCRQIGGGILTNFLDPSQCLRTVGSSVNLCTDGTATGDLRGAVGVQVLQVTGTATGLILHNQHHWVTESGDTIFLNPADATAYATPDNNRFLTDYLNGIVITGGTGAFAGATGELTSVFGGVDLNLAQVVSGQVTLRYARTVCFKPVSPP